MAPDRNSAAASSMQRWRPRYVGGDPNAPEGPNAQERQAEGQQMLNVEARGRITKLLIERWKGKQRPEYEAALESWSDDDEDFSSADVPGYTGM